MVWAGALRLFDRANFVCGVDRYGYNVVAALPPPGSPKLAKSSRLERRP